MEASASQAAGRKAPVHLWIVGALATLGSGFGGVDFLLTNLRNPAYVAQLPPDVIDFIDAFPAWVTMAWGTGVGFAFLGSLLLLGRSLSAAYCFAISLLALAAVQFRHFAIGLPGSMNTPLGWLTSGVIWIVALGVLLYAIRMRTRMVLR